MRELDTTLTAVAEAFAVPPDSLDTFVFRRVDGGRMVHLGGGGRGTGWAGVVEIHLESEPLISHAWAMRRPTRYAGPTSTQAFGPYWAASAVVVPLPPDQLVVFGSSGQLQMPDDETVRQLATQVIGHIAAVSPAKRLADELELLHAVRRATATTDADLRSVAQHIVTAAAEALSCELGLLWLPEREVLAVADVGPSSSLPDSARTDEPAAEDADAPHHDGLITMMEQLLAEPQMLPRCQQDNSVHALAPPLNGDSTVVAWFAVELGPPVRGVLLLCHTIANPRGFTLQCQQIGNRIAEAAVTPLATALAHERLNDELARASDEARRDSLTGVHNRLGWQEAVEDFRRDRRGGTASVVMLDVDDLKQVNDEHGHRAGDDMLRAISNALLASTRSRDIVARIGGDEFAVLLPETDADDCASVVARFSDRIDELEPIGDRPVAASLGWATCSASDDLDWVMREADRRMYHAKHSRSQR
ncbi:MAG: GGDEF domain-containing protein [Actinobacteria bacterium]|nr:GGDEF domain-containing protein [Actinomycetota bacterium]